MFDASHGKREIPAGIENTISSSTSKTRSKWRPIWRRWTIKDCGERSSVPTTAWFIRMTPAAGFDLSIVSRHGRGRADELKLANRSTYQELIFEGLGLRFSGETYLLPRPLDRSSWVTSQLLRRLVRSGR